MNFRVYTLIDITATGSRRGEDPRAYQQQQNYMSFLQTLSLRFNPIIEKSPVVEQMTVGNLPFGSDYKGKQNVWSVSFSSESEIGVGLDVIAEDFDLVPIISGLDETAKLPLDVFRTKDSKSTNLYFEVDDK